NISIGAGARPLRAVYLSLRKPKVLGGGDYRASHGMGVGVIRQCFDLLRAVHRGCGLEERQYHHRVEVGLSLRPIRRRGDGGNTYGDKRSPARMRTGYADGLEFIRLRAADHVTLGLGG